MNAGELTERIAFLKPKQSSGAIVNLDDNSKYEEYKGTWAKAEFYSSKEVYSSNGINILNAVKFIVRTRKDIIQNMAISWQGNIYEIVGIRPLDDTKAWLLINTEVLKHE